MLTKIKNFIRQEMILFLAGLLAVCSCIFHRPQLDYIDFDVIYVLLSLMLVVAGLQSINFLDWIAVELLNICNSMRRMVLVLLVLTYISSMFVTNDVALLTFVPLALVIGKALKIDMERIVVLQTLAANLGSMFTPFGNPQNLFLYAHYGYSAGKFLGLMFLPCILSVLYLIFLLFRRQDIPLVLQLKKISYPKPWILGIYLSLLFLNIAAVLHLLDKVFALMITILAVFLINKRLFFKVDYSLLLTFCAFFVFIGNVSDTSAVEYLKQSMLGSAEGTYFAGLFVSQFISNVPAAMLLAALTKEADALLLGVNIGGLGTMIASMASVISYKLFVAEHPYQAGKYVRTFLYYNFAGLLFLGILVYFIMIKE